MNVKLQVLNATDDALLEKRRYGRSPFDAPVRVQWGSWFRKRSFAGVIQDASATGIRLRLPEGHALPRGERVSVQWDVPSTLSQTPLVKSYKLRGTVVRTDSAASGQPSYGVRWKGLAHEQVHAADARSSKTITVLAALALAALIALLKTRNVISFWYQPFFQVYSVVAALLVLSRAALSVFYREPEDQGFMPSVSLIVAVKNEEANIAETVRRCFQSRYPADLLELIVVDDGSTDGTWGVLQALQAEYPHLRLFQFEKNRGKRHAMALGARKAHGAILVYIDSDCQLEADGLYRLVQPFNDPQVGAVAGHTLVIVEQDNFISKMEAVRYFVSQRVMKAAESLFGSVTCCPGPFSAYRREAVMKILPAWENQRFLGAQATFGDDRSLTNFILRDYRIIYHAGARCRTFVPKEWAVFFRQQLRWKKSWVRESTIAPRFMYREHPIAAISYYLSIVVTLVSPIVLLRALFYSPLALQSVAFAPYMAGLVLVFLFLGLLYRYHTQSSHWYYGVAFAILYAGFFSLQTYYAVLTVRQNHWGTR